ncbi:hypothetical protein D5086_027753 [Populus alba]|uniref:Uncharacterized protein n=1 Tax=Populus alba TaxID=43335 RepID=A0ACC4AW79_POPAL
MRKQRGICICFLAVILLKKGKKDERQRRSEKIRESKKRAMMDWKLNRQVKGGVMEWIKGKGGGGGAGLR